MYDGWYFVAEMWQTASPQVEVCVALLVFLIMAKGCFSYYAALISDGIKIFEPKAISEDDLPSWRWRSVPPAQNWIPRLTDGSFDREAFERQLLIIMRAKPKAATKASTGGL